MSKITLITLEHRAVTLACSSFALLLSACGGGGDQERAPAQAQTAAGATVPQQARPPDPGTVGTSGAGGPDDADSADAAPAAAQLPDVAPQSFAMAGYAAAPGAEDQARGAASPGAALYVSPQGHDDNPGSATRPFRSLARAARAVAPGVTVYVAPGTYSGGIRTSASGRADARIAFVSTERWGARIVPPARSAGKSAWDNRGDYVDIVGFDIDGATHREGTRWTSGIYNGGSHDTIRSNHVHHIAQQAACTSAGGAAIGVDGYYRGVDSHVIANLVHDIGPAGCRFVQGIYVSTTGSVKNNVVYRVAEAGIHLWHDARDVVIANNTVTASNTGIVVGGGDFYHTSGPNDRTAVYNNIVYDNKMGISEQGRTGRNNSYRNNLVYKNSSYDFRLKNGLTHSGTVSSAPLFVGETSVALPDFSLSASSPAVGRATPQHAASTDFNGRPRNVFTGFDIGAYQH
ncbi:DUF1565 domain-containing protein [Massilia violaceinigra]|uniref:DUF1565 domain-containing protein n=1 Tax=Massilia violaceinigra TaxID=2045208 RepID=A0ABY4A3L3_9BURK|nr:DUF1565 domain-containing protein [Massilia violaceinigra]UOD29358.1 DUF1565 domain-containing protein [Massilia violaceinigra]